MTWARFLVGDVRAGLATLDAGSVDVVMTSPPFLALRSYLPGDHAAKAAEVGSEATPGAYLDVLLDVVEDCARVLAPHGSLVVELGDTYSGSGGAGGDYGSGGLRDGQPRFDGSARRAGGGRVHRAGHASSIPGRRVPGTSVHWSTETRGDGWPALAKCKVMIPQLFAVALAYGFNPLTGRHTAPWRVRNVVAWCRPNPSPGRDGDKWRPATSFLVVACKSARRYWDPLLHDNARAAEVTRSRDQLNRGSPRYHTAGDTSAVAQAEAGAPLLDWWEIPTAPYQGAHYATFPRALVEPVVAAMCPRRVCTVCGQPSRREVVQAPEYAAARARINRNEHAPTTGWAVAVGADQRAVGRGGFRRDQDWDQGADPPNAEYITTGWSDCGHDAWRSGMVPTRSRAPAPRSMWQWATGSTASASTSTRATRTSRASAWACSSTSRKCTHERHHRDVGQVRDALPRAHLSRVRAPGARPPGARRMRPTGYARAARADVTAPGASRAWG